MITLSNISKSYGDHIIFKDYSLSIEQGEFIALTGASGKGKTTLLNIIGLIEPHDSGDLEILSYKNPSLHGNKGIKLLRNELAFVFQNFGLIEAETVLYNLKIATRFSNLKSQEEKILIAAALERVGLPGIQSKKIYQLSGGEQQRVALARIILKPSSIILADEPTGSLDSDNRDHVLSLLKEFHEEGKTVVVVTHDPKVELCASRVVRL